MTLQFLVRDSAATEQLVGTGLQFGIYRDYRSQSSTLKKTDVGPAA
jgi:hypothetical protein